MKDIDHYQIAIIGLAVNVSLPILERTKISLTKGIRCIESDDRCFIYDPDNLGVPRRKGESAGRICNYRPPDKWEWQNALKESIELMCLEDQDSHKLVIMVTDKIKESDLYQISMGFNWDVKHDAGCRFVLCGIGNLYDKTFMKSLCECHQECEYIHHREPEELEKTIEKLYRRHLKSEGLPTPSFVSLDSLKEEYDWIESEDIRD